LALIHGERGADIVAESLQDAAISAVNVTEIVAQLSEQSLSAEDIHDVIEEFGLEIVAFDEESAFEAGLLRRPTRRFGLSFGDRACLALASSLGVPALTADRIWEKLDIGVEVRLIR
jgi:PIN domain nuclease of toxin-antitoxin system